MDFIALDFETANSRADSACQLALVVVQGGQLVDEHCWLVRPPRMYFSRRNILIHGIQPDHVQRAPTMRQLWPDIERLIDGQVLVAHNASFDIGVLVASLAAFDIACPNLEFSCTRALARRTWPGRNGYGLKPLGSWLGIQFHHHDALEDARCCAQIALRASRTFPSEQFGSLVEFEKFLKLSRGRYSLGRISGPRALGRQPFWPARQSALPAASQATAPSSTVSGPHLPRSTAPGLATQTLRELPAVFQRPRTAGRGTIDPVTILEAAAGNLPLAGKSIVCLGTLRGLSLDETRTLIEALGGRCQSSITAEVDYVIAGGGVLLDEAQQMLSRSNEAAPATIRVLSERQFLSLLPAGKAAVRW